MKKMQIIARLLIANLILLVFTHFAVAQEMDKDVIKPVKDTIQKEGVKSRIEISLEGMNKAIYAGRNYGIDQVGLNPSIAFNHKSGLRLSAYSYGMGKTPGLIAETDLGISFTRKITSKFNITPGYSYILNRSDSAKLLNNVLSLALALDFNFVSLNNYAAMSFGKATGWYDEASMSKYVSLASKGEGQLSLSPTFVLVSGTKESLATFGHGATSYKKAINNIVGNGKSNGRGKGNTSGGSTTTTTTTTTTSITTENTKKFMLLSYDFMLPLTYTYKVFSFAIIPHYDIPVNFSAEESSLAGNPFYVTGKIVLSLPVSR